MRGPLTIVYQGLLPEENIVNTILSSKLREAEGSPHLCIFHVIGDSTMAPMLDNVDTLCSYTLINLLD